MYSLVLAPDAEYARRPLARARPDRVTAETIECEAGGLIRAIAISRDRAAFVKLFLGFGPRIKAYLLRLGLDNAAAEEATQDVMLTLWRKAGQFDPARATAAAWIFTIARNTRIDIARRNLREPQPDPIDEVAPDPVPDAALAAADRTHRVAAALSTLPAEQADVIRLAFFDDRPHAEIEHALGIPLGTVKSRLRLALRKLRGMLENDL